MSSSCIFHESSGLQKTNCSILLNWCVRKIPLVSLPCAPASFLKLVLIPTSLTGRSSAFRTSSMYMAAMGCSEVAIRYRSSFSIL